MNAKIVCLSAVAFIGLGLTGVLRGNAGVSLIQRLDSRVDAAQIGGSAAPTIDTPPSSGWAGLARGKREMSRKCPRRRSIPLRPVARPEAACSISFERRCILRAKPHEHDRHTPNSPEYRTLQNG